MKNSFLKKIALFLTVAMVAGSLAACGNTETTETPSETTETETENTEATETADNDDSTLVVGYDYFSNKFSPFFAKTDYDQNVSSMAVNSLLSTDREGNVVLNGKEGEVIPYNGVDYTYYSLSNCVITQNDDGTVTYDFDLRDDVTFSDGTPLTADDVIFSMYTYSDPTFDGSATFYALPILGMEEYRGNMATLSGLIIAAGEDNTDFTYFTEEQQTAYFAALNEAGPLFAQDIIDYCLAAGLSADDAGGSEVALGMVSWGFGTLNDDATTVVGAATGTEYAVADVTVEDYWTELVAEYEGDYQALSDTETANTDLFTYVDEVLGDAAADYAKGVNTGDSAPNIAGIEKTGDYSVRVTMTQFDAAAIYRMAIDVAPLHYYGDASLYDYENNMFGFNKGDLSIARSKTTHPMGSGAYVFQSYENGVVTFTANENYFLGAPKTKTVLFRETAESDKLAGVVSGAFDIANPSLSLALLESIEGYNSNGELDGEVINTEMVDNLGYGYIGINANNVKVGNDEASDASKALRKALATIFAVHRDTVINSYYGEMASVIQYPISNTSWAAPRPADEGYAVAYSTDAEGNSIYTADMTDEDKYAAALDAAISFLIEAGYTWDEAASTFTEAPEGASMTYEIIIPAGGEGDHPSFGILTAAKEQLAAIGITLEINDPADSNVLWAATESGTAEMFVAAWQATPDPDMYQVYHSSNIVGEGGTDSNHYAVADDTLDELIMAARNSADQSYRKATYKECLDIILDWAVEIPTYQRQNGFIFSSERVNIDTLTPDMTPYWSWMSEIEKVEVK